MKGNNLLENVSYRFNSIVFQFKENMYRYNDYFHSYLNRENYAFHEQDSLLLFPPDVRIQEFSDINSVRFMLPDSLNGILQYGTRLRIGHVELQDIQYIKSALGNVHDLCQDIVLASAAPELSISDGYFKFIDGSTLRYYYQGENHFGQVSPEDFYVLVGSSKVYALSAAMENSKTVLFTFPEDTLEYAGRTITMYTDTYPDKETYSKDLYGYGITQHSHVSTTGSIHTFSISSIGSPLSFYKILFNSRVAIFSQFEFSLLCNNQEYPLRTATFDSSRLLCSMASMVPSGTTYEDPAGIHTVVPLADIGTQDITGNKIYHPEPIYAELFIASEGEINFKYNTFREATVKLTFNKDINIFTFITDSHFDNTDIPWSGNSLTLPPGSVIIAKSGSLCNLSLKNNPSFGILSFKEKPNYAFINDNITNTEACTMTFNGKNEITLNFSKDETMKSNSPGIEAVYYTGSDDVISRDDYFLCRNNVNVKVKYNNPLIIEPINDAWQNPFNGGNFSISFDIMIDTEHTLYDYGNRSYETFINGVVHCKGTMKFGTILRFYMVIPNYFINDVQYV